MIISEGYSIMQEPKKNRIIINLPQTVATMNTTTEPLSQRYLTITEGQEAVILGIVKAMYEGGEGEKMQLSKEDTTFISRQAAIDICNDELLHTEDYSPIRTWNRILQLPSVQPEIIRCNDCKHYDGRPCGIVDWYNTADDFCSRAERRTDE